VAFISEGAVIRRPRSALSFLHKMRLVAWMPPAGNSFDEWRYNILCSFMTPTDHMIHMVPLAAHARTLDVTFANQCCHSFGEQ
jgi:hypothetical protein